MPLEERVSTASQKWPPKEACTTGRAPPCYVSWSRGTAIQWEHRNEAWPTKRKQGFFPGLALRPVTTRQLLIKPEPPRGFWALVGLCVCVFFPFQTPQYVLAATEGMPLGQRCIQGTSNSSKYPLLRSCFWPSAKLTQGIYTSPFTVPLKHDN